MNSPLSLLEKSLPAATVENWSPPSESHVGRNAINTAILALRSMVGDVPEDMNNPYLVPEVRRLLDFVHETCLRMSSQFGPTVRTEFGPTPVGQATSSLGG